MPWAEIKAVVLWKQASAASMPYLGVLLHPDSATLHADSVVGWVALRFDLVWLAWSAPGSPVVRETGAVCAALWSGWTVVEGFSFGRVRGRSRPS